MTIPEDIIIDKCIFDSEEAGLEFVKETRKRSRVLALKLNWKDWSETELYDTYQANWIDFPTPDYDIPKNAKEALIKASKFGLKHGLYQITLRKKR